MGDAARRLGLVIQQGVGPQQFDHVARPRQPVPQVHDREVHIDDIEAAQRASRPRLAPAAGGADHAIGIAGAHKGHAGGLFGGDGRPVADQLASAHVTDVENGRLQTRHGPKPGVWPLLRSAAKKADPRAHQVEPVVGPQEGPSGGRKARPSLWEQRSYGLEGGQLLGVSDVVGDRPRPEMAHDKLDLQPRQAVGLGEGGGLIPAQPLAVHASVHLEDAGQGD